MYKRQVHPQAHGGGEVGNRLLVGPLLQNFAQMQHEHNGAWLILTIENHMDMLKMDKDLLCELLLNLIDNAGKASPRGSMITLVAKNNIISVSDDGHGIPAEELHRLTEPFYMVDKARSRKQGGMGLGLALVQEIARLHRAHLVFESEAGKGTTVKAVFEHEKEAEK